MHIDTIIGQFFFTLRSPARTAFFTIATILGNVQTIILLFLIIAGWLLYRNKKQLLIAFIIDLGLAETITFFAKLLFHRARPLHALMLETDYSFPSGHATVAISFYSFIAFMLFLRYKDTTRRSLAVIAAIFIALLIGLSRLYLGVHYFTDIAAGYAVGTIGFLAGMRAYAYLNKKPFVFTWK